MRLHFLPLGPSPIWPHGHMGAPPPLTLDTASVDMGAPPLHLVTTSCKVWVGGWVHMCTALPCTRGGPAPSVGVLFDGSH